MANKKITQLASKTSVLSTDLFPIGDATTGTLYKKTIAELQAAIGGAVVSVQGKVGVIVLTADDIAEAVSPTNLYFTNTRARNAISLTSTGSSGSATYSASTGVINVPTYTLAGLGGINATFLSGGSGISYNSTTGVISYSGTIYTDSAIRALFSAGTGLSYNSVTGAFSYSGTVYNDSAIRTLFSATAPLSYNSTTGAFTISQANTTTNGFLSSTDWNTFNNKQATISLTTTGSSGASTFSANTLNIPTYTLAGLGGITATFLSGGTGITYNSTTGVISTTITQYTDALARAAHSATAPITYNSTTGAIGITQATTSTNGYLSSTDWNTFNNKQGTITLTTTGTSGAATFSAGTLNIPQYQAVLTNPITGTGTSGYHAKWTSSSTLGNGLIYDTGTFIGINKTSAVSNEKLSVTGSTNIWGVVRIENDTNQADVNHGTLNIVNTRTTYAVGNEASIMFSAFNSTASMQPRATIGMQVASDLGGHLVFNTRNDSASGERMRITSGGNVGIGTTSPTDRLDIYSGTGSAAFMNLIGNGNTANVSCVVFGQNSDDGGYFWNRKNSYVSIGTNNSERVRITAGGNILLGTTTDNGERLYVSGAIRATGTITANSDISLKKNLLKIENALEKVEQINGYTYEFKEDDSKRHAGVIAQEIQEVLPEIVNKGNDGILGVEYGNISALLIEAIKDLKSQNESLVARLEALEK